MATLYIIGFIITMVVSASLLFSVILVKVVNNYWDSEMTKYIIVGSFSLAACIMFGVLISKSEPNSEHTSESKYQTCTEQAIIHDVVAHKRIVTSKDCDSSKIDTITISDWNP